MSVGGGGGAPIRQEIDGGTAVDFPLETSHDLALASAKYGRLIRRLIYLTITCLQVYYPVHMLSQFMQAPRQGHMNTAKRVKTKKCL